MKLSVLQEKIKEGLNFSERISSKSLTLPILNNILISTEKNFLNIISTDLEIALKWWTLAKIEKEGKITIPSRLFFSFINLLPNKKIDLDSKGFDLNVDCENYKTQIKGLNPEEYPIIPQISQEDFINIKSSIFCQGLSQVVDIPIISTTKPEISGIYFTFQKNNIIMAATDSFRLGEKKIFIKNSSLKKDFSFILPQKTAREIINIFGEKEGDMKIYFSPNQVMFEYLMPETDHPQIQLISRLIEGEYPNYQDIIPKQSTTQFSVNKSEFLNQIKTASLFSSKVNEIKLKINPDKKKIDICSQSQDLGDYQSSFGGEIKGEQLDVSFNYRYLMDGLLNIKSSEIIFELNGDSGPSILKPLGDETYLYVVMPIKAN
jgi:DNA polymerase III subunit beta